MFQRIAPRIVALLVLATSGCANKTIVSGEPPGDLVERTGEMSIDWQPFACSRDQLFDGALRIAQRYNLKVETLEKDSGFIEFKHSNLDVKGLIRFTRSPFVEAYEGYTLSGYPEYVGYYGAAVGSVDLTFLMTPKDSGTTELAVRSHWMVRGGTETVVNTSGFFEDRFVTDLTSDTDCAMVGRWSRDSQKKLNRLRQLADNDLLDGDDYWAARDALLRRDDAKP